MKGKNWEARISKLEHFTTKDKLIFATPTIKKMVVEMRELWEEVKQHRQCEKHDERYNNGG